MPKTNYGSNQSSVFYRHKNFETLPLSEYKVLHKWLLKQ